MFDSDNRSVSVTMPSPPYPQCQECHTGLMMPCLKPLMRKIGGSMAYYSNDTHYPIPGTAVVYWKCNKCKNVVE